MADIEMREWLNRKGHHSVGAVYTTLSRGTHDKGEAHHVDASMIISDCARQITLDFDSWSVPDVENAIHKVRVLERHLRAVRVELEATRVEMIAAGQ